jgi:hypothetical protein
MEKSRSWSSAHDWKSCIPQKGIEGSNPSFSATIRDCDNGHEFFLARFLTGTGTKNKKIFRFACLLSMAVLLLALGACAGAQTCKKVKKASAMKRKPFCYFI